MKLSGGNLETTGSSVEVIEELLPLHDVKVTLRPAKKVTKVTLEPQGKEIEFTETNDRIKITINKFECQQMVVMKH